MEELRERDKRGQIKLEIYKGLSERFLSKIRKLENGCWEWSGTVRKKDGYGMIWYRGKNVRAHRVSYLLHNGSMPDGLLICHSCDYPLCVNPLNLFAGTHGDNLRDMGNKGRQVFQKNPVLVRGENNPQSKLTEADVVNIKRRLANGANQSAIAREFRVKPDTINKIARGRNWANVKAS